MAPHSTLRLAADETGLQVASAILHEGGLVAFPTETVYGLGACALNHLAVRGIFAAKRRPADDPLIVHVLDTAGASAIAELSPLAERLAERFWPGPLTLVLPRREAVPHEVTAGLPSVGVRVPAHRVARALLQTCGLPLAAPSANLFGRPSPTRAEHVLNDLDGWIHAVLDAGLTTIGVESTIVGLLDDEPRLLRPGGVPAETIESVLGCQLLPPPSGKLLAPGGLTSHYAPRTPFVLVAGRTVYAQERLVAAVRQALDDGRAGILLLDEDADVVDRRAHIERVGSWSDPSGTAVRLFDAMRRLDDAGLDVLFARDVAHPLEGLGRALADRLRRAASEVLE